MQRSNVDWEAFRASDNFLSFWLACISILEQIFWQIFKFSILLFKTAAADMHTKQQQKGVALNNKTGTIDIK